MAANQQPSLPFGDSTAPDPGPALLEPATDHEVARDSPSRRRITAVLAALRRSKFRSGFVLRGREWQYLQEKGLPMVLDHAADFVAKRLAPAQPEKDGKQTPWRGHPVFIAQHATATCCRGCLEKWHHMPHGVELSDEEQRYVVEVIGAWLAEQQTP